MLEQIKRAAEVDADVIGDRLSALENIHGLRISGKGRLAVSGKQPSAPLTMLAQSGAGP